MSAWSCKHVTNTNDHSRSSRSFGRPSYNRTVKCFNNNSYHELNNKGATGTVLQTHFILIRT